MKVWPGIPLFRAVAPVRDRGFLGLGMFLGLEGSGKRQGLGLSGLVVKSGCYENFSRDTSVLGRGSR